jgi:chromosome segregation ATPase
MTRRKEASQMTRCADKSRIAGILKDYKADGVSTEAGRSAGIPPLTADLRGLFMAIKDLEAQLRSFIRINQTLESDLADARRQLSDLNEERDHLVQRVEEMEAEAVPMEELRVEVKQLHRERDTMAAKVHDLARALASSEHGVHDMMLLVDRVRVERDDASEEAACLNAQFSEAMEKIEDLHRELETHREQKEVLEVRLKRLQEQLEATSGADGTALCPNIDLKM